MDIFGIIVDTIIVCSLCGISFICGKVYERQQQERNDCRAELKAHELYRAGSNKSAEGLVAPSSWSGTDPKGATHATGYGGVSGGVHSSGEQRD